jgi:hypothetical protein
MQPSRGLTVEGSARFGVGSLSPCDGNKDGKFTYRNVRDCKLTHCHTVLFKKHRSHFPSFFPSDIHMLGRFRGWPRGHRDDLSSMILPWSDLFQLWFPPRKRKATSSSGLGLGCGCGARSDPPSPEADKSSTPTGDFLEA